MDERECLVKAQEAEAFANATDNSMRRNGWESIAYSYRQLAILAAQLRLAVASESL